MPSFSEATAQSIDDLFRQLNSTVDGLTPADAAGRLAANGLNEVRGRGTSGWDIFFRQFKSSFVYLLIVAALIAMGLGEYTDGAMIFLFVAINAGLGFYQEYHSEKTVKLLSQYTARSAQVRRSGHESVIPTSQIVPGDVVILEEGDVIPADVRILKAHNLMIDESVLTGESAPVSKTTDRLETATRETFAATNIGFSGTIVSTGRAEGLVVATGRQTAFGQAAKLAVETSRTSVFEKNIRSFSRFILRLIVATLVVVFVANLIINGAANIAELAVFSIALAVSVIPEALPVVTMFSLSRSALRLAKNKVVVKRLSAIEDLGSIEVLCTDKTGTLTENVLTVAELHGPDEHATLLTAALAATDLGDRKSRQPNNAFDLAVWTRLSANEHDQIRREKRLDEMPFNPARRSNAVLVAQAGRSQLIVRGAPETILDGCTNVSDDERTSLNTWLVDQGHRGRRVLTVATKDLGQATTFEPDTEISGLTYIGTVSFVDPIKKSTRQAIDRARQLGVAMKILTGDSAEVAAAVAKEVGLITDLADVVTGAQLEAMTDEARTAAIDRHAVFARMSPQQKFLVIANLEKRQEVGFLGEGINDAPALKVANVALVVDKASDVAREAADIVLLKKGLDVIIDGVSEGRQVFANTIKYIKTTLAANFGNFYAVAIVSFFIPFLPMLPIQLLMVNLLSDFPMIAIAADTVDAEELHRPRSYHVKDIVLFAVILGVVSTVFDFIMFGSFVGKGEAVLQTNWFIGSILTELVFLFSVRTRLSMFKAKRPAGIVIGLSLAAILITVALPFTAVGQDVFHFIRPSAMNLVTIVMVVVAYLVVTEIVKLGYYRHLGRRYVG